MPTLSNPAYSSGQFEFFLNGATDVSYTIQASSNLIDWDSVAAHAAPAQVSVSATGHSYRFFRAVFP